MKKETTIIQKPGENYLVGEYVETDSADLVVACHGMATDRKEPAFQYALGLANQLGLSTFSFDFSGSGDSPGEGGLNLIDRVTDLQYVLDYLAKTRKRITLLGISFSGIASAIAAMKYSPVYRLITVNGFFDFGALQGTLSRLLKIYLFKYPHKRAELVYLQEQYTPESISVPTLVIHGKKDTIISPQQSVSFYNQLETTKKLSLIEDTTHELSNSNEVESVIKIALKWMHHPLKRTLPQTEKHQIAKPALQQFLTLSPIQVIQAL